MPIPSNPMSSTHRHAGMERQSVAHRQHREQPQVGEQPPVSEQPPVGEQRPVGEQPPVSEQCHGSRRVVLCGAFAGAVTAATVSTVHTLQFHSASRSTQTTIAMIGRMARGGGVTTGATSVALYDAEGWLLAASRRLEPAPLNSTRKVGCPTAATLSRRRYRSGLDLGIDRIGRHRSPVSA